MPIATAQ